MKLSIEGISSRVNLQKLGEDIFLIKDKKSRIIMNESLTIIEINKKVYEQFVKNLVLKTDAPICSKSIKILQENGIKIISVTTEKK